MRRVWFAESPNGDLASAKDEQEADYLAAMEHGAWARRFVLFTEEELTKLARMCFDAGDRNSKLRINGRISEEFDEWWTDKGGKL